MKRLRFFGEWSEHNGEGLPSLLAQPRNVLSEKESLLVAAYLEGCPVLVFSPGIIYSMFSEGVFAGSGSILTDGVWAWQDTMTYYVRHYGISPPQDFMRHIRAKNYIHPSEKEVDLLVFSFPEKPEDMPKVEAYLQ